MYYFLDFYSRIRHYVLTVFDATLAEIEAIATALMRNCLIDTGIV